MQGFALMIYTAGAVIWMRRTAKPFDFLLYRCLYYESRYLFRSNLPNINRNSDTKGLRFLCFCDIIFSERRKRI